jgi:predicted PhzF superfamily epimerase YddE/YHI9
VREIKILLRDNDLTQKEMQQLAEQYNTSLSSLNHIKHGRTWKHVVV